MIALCPVRLLLLVCGLVAAPLCAQDQVESNAQPLPTLHAYADLIQIPVLVLSPDLQSVPSVKPEQFSLSIDNGPKYRPTHVRPEGQDAISLTIVLDFDGAAASLMPKIGEAIGKAAPHGFTPRDRVSVMAMQCGLKDVLDNVPADAAELQAKIAEAAKTWAQRDKATPCKEDSHLWDTLAMAMLRLSHLPGRSVIIAVTDGVDRGSSHTSEEVAVEMPAFAVTTFAVQTEARLSPTASGEPSVGRSVTPLGTVPMGQFMAANPLRRVCELSGGMVLPADRGNAGKQFARIPELLRGRYILDFPRPSNSTEGVHKFDVQVARGDYFVRSSGITFPLPDPRTVTDPTTLHSDPALTPKMGAPKVPPPLSH